MKRFRILAISLLILFSSSSRTLAPRMSAMNWAQHQPPRSLCSTALKAHLRQTSHTRRHLDSRGATAQLPAINRSIVQQLCNKGHQGRREGGRDEALPVRQLLAVCSPLEVVAARAPVLQVRHVGRAPSMHARRGFPKCLISSSVAIHYMRTGIFS